MEIIKLLLMVSQITSGVAIIGLVLLQHGKGADAGAGFGGGGGSSAGSNSIFGASGSANFLSRTTAILAVIFFTTTVAINWFSGYKSSSNLLHQLATPTNNTATPQNQSNKQVPISNTSNNIPN